LGACPEVIVNPIVTIYHPIFRKVIPYLGKQSHIQILSDIEKSWSEKTEVQNPKENNEKKI